MITARENLLLHELISKETDKIRFACLQINDKKTVVTDSKYLVTMENPVNSETAEPIETVCLKSEDIKTVLSLLPKKTPYSNSSEIEFQIVDSQVEFFDGNLKVSRVETNYPDAEMIEQRHKDKVPVFKITLNLVLLEKLSKVLKKVSSDQMADFAFFAADEQIEIRSETSDGRQIFAALMPCK